MSYIIPVPLDFHTLFGELATFFTFYKCLMQCRKKITKKSTTSVFHKIIHFSCFNNILQLGVSEIYTRIGRCLLNIEASRKFLQYIIVHRNFHYEIITLYILDSFIKQIDLV